MKEPTEYEMLLSDERCVIRDIQELKDYYQDNLSKMKYNLKKVRKALKKYEVMSVVHISDSLEKIPN